MKSLLVLGLIVMAGMLIVGCAGVMPGKDGIFPGGLVTAVTSPLHIDSDLAREFSANPEKFEILGEVEGASSNMNVLGLVAMGNGGYIPALEDAKAKAGADALINVVVDVKKMSVLFLFSKTTTTVKGLAIKLKK